MEVVLTDAKRYEANAAVLWDAICEQIRTKGIHDVPRDAVASSIGLEPPITQFTEQGKEFRATARVLKDAGLVYAPVNFEFVRLTEAGIRNCEGS